MKINATRLAVVAGFAISIAIAFITCKGETGQVSTKITPKFFPSDLKIPGFKFPEDSTVIYGWLNSMDTVSIYKHAWGIWAGLTSNSGEKYNGEALLIYETWLGTAEVSTLIKNGVTDCQQMTKTGRTQVRIPRQRAHSARLMSLTSTVDTNANVVETVAYNPEAVCHTTQNKLYKTSVLSSYAKPGKIGSIPEFPVNAITTKPVYYIGEQVDNLIRVPSWQGPPSPNRNYPSSDWNSYVYVDVKNGQAANKIAVPAPDKPTPAQVAAATCNLNDFIYFKLDSTAAKYFNTQYGKKKGVKAGALALLVAMHVTSKEISNWTWQTFWWTPNPEQPSFPSNATAASLRPAELKGAARHYAVATAYNMVWPNQPLVGGTNKGVKPNFAYNPYLEPGLGDIESAAYMNQLDTAYHWGVQSNCMTCHALAFYKPGASAANQPAPYSADQYISMADTIYLNKVQVDFAWSIMFELIEN